MNGRRVRETSFDCAFCRGQVTLLETAGDGMPTGVTLVGGLVHTLPTCQEFEALQPDVFLRRTNEAIARRRSKGAN